jgi:signal transduction histidine kinase
MQERTERLGGSFELFSSPGVKTEIRIVIPHN